MARSYWLMKSEPDVFSWDKLVSDGKGMWDGVRNYTARNNLRAMKVGDLAFFYHSNIGKEIVGIVRIVREHYPDPTANGADWSVVDVEPVKPMVKSVTLEAIKKEAALTEMDLVKRSRLSVQRVEKDAFDYILAMGKTKVR